MNIHYFRLKNFYSAYTIHIWKRLFTDRVSVKKKHLTGKEPVMKEHIICTLSIIRENGGKIYKVNKMTLVVCTCVLLKKIEICIV